MDTRKLFYLMLALIAFSAILLICYKGIRVNHDMGTGKQKITIPDTEHIMEIDRRNGKEPFRLHLKSPSRQIEIERED